MGGDEGFLGADAFLSSLEDLREFLWDLRHDLHGEGRQAPRLYVAMLPCVDRISSEMQKLVRETTLASFVPTLFTSTMKASQ